MSLPRKRVEKKKTIHGLNRTVAILVLVCLCIGGMTMVVARYLNQTVKKDVAVAKEFYFTSDLLDGKTHNITALESDGTASVSFQLMNHADALRYSEVDIPYSVTLKENENEIPLNEQNAVNASGKIAFGSAQAQVVTVKGLQAGHMYTITAATSGTYQASLTGTFSINTVDSSLHASVDNKNSAYIEVNIWTAEMAVENAVTLKYCDGLIPDNTDSLMDRATTGANSITIGDMEENSSHVFRFFKEDTAKNYVVSVKGMEVTVSEQ